MRAAVGTNIPPNELRKQMRAFDAQAFLDSAGVARKIAEYPKSEKKNYVKTAMQFPSHAVTDTIRSTPMRPPFARRVSIGTETPGAQSLARPLTTSSSAIDASASCMEGAITVGAGTIWTSCRAQTTPTTSRKELPRIGLGPE